MARPQAEATKRALHRVLSGKSRYAAKKAEGIKWETVDRACKKWEAENGMTIAEWLRLKER